MLIAVRLELFLSGLSNCIWRRMATVRSILQDHVACFRNSPPASEGTQGISTLSADQNIDILPDGVVDGEDWDFGGVISGKSEQHFGEKRWLQDS